MKLRFSIITFLCFFSLTAQRIVNFPKKKVFVKELPAKENLWIFIMAGQSNMAGRGMVEPQDTISNNRILTVDEFDRWYYAKEPLHFYEHSMAGLDSGLSFARELLENVPDDISIGILPSAVGGSSIEQWKNNDSHRCVKLLSNLESKIAFAQEAGTLKAVLWHQGESNANKTSLPTYDQNLQDFMQQVRKMANNDCLPVFLGQLGHYAIPAEKQENWDALNRIIENYTETNSYSYLIRTDSLTHRGDYLHFDSESQRDLGQRFARKYAKIFLSKNEP